MRRQIELENDRVAARESLSIHLKQKSGFKKTPNEPGRLCTVATQRRRGVRLHFSLVSFWWLVWNIRKCELSPKNGSFLRSSIPTNVLSIPFLNLAKITFIFNYLNFFSLWKKPNILKLYSKRCRNIKKVIYCFYDGIRLSNHGGGGGNDSSLVNGVGLCPYRN